MPALMRENFQSARSAKKNSQNRTARNSSCGKFTANIFSPRRRIRVKTLGIYSSVLTLENLLVLSCPRIALTALQRNADLAPLGNHTAVVKRSLRRDRISL